jgi:hypothetical protein
MACCAQDVQVSYHHSLTWIRRSLSPRPLELLLEDEVNHDQRRFISMSSANYSLKGFVGSGMPKACESSLNGHCCTSPCVLT